MKKNLLMLCLYLSITKTQLWTMQRNSLNKKAFENEMSKLYKACISNDGKKVEDILKKSSRKTLLVNSSCPNTPSYGAYKNYPLAIVVADKCSASIVQSFIKYDADMNKYDPDQEMSTLERALLMNEVDSHSVVQVLIQEAGLTQVSSIFKQSLNSEGIKKLRAMGIEV